MSTFAPFKGLRYASSDDLRALVSPPYDVISPEEQKVLHDRDPHNAVRLELPMDDGTGDRYERAGDTFKRWVDEGVLARDPEPSFYVYRQDFIGPRGDRSSVVGIIGGLGVGPFGEETGVLPHERTMPGPKKDRLAMMNALPVNVSPIYGIYRGGGELGPYFDSLENRPTAARVADSDEILHRLWVVSAPGEVSMLADAVSSTTVVIADGHHRYETALAYHEQHADEPGDHAAMMSFVVDADHADLVVLPYNRALRADIDPATLAANLRDFFGATSIETTPTEALEASTADHAFVFVLSDERLLVELDDARVVKDVGERAPAWRALDVVALHEVVVPEILDGAEPELTFNKDPEVIEGLVRDEGWTAGVLLKAMHATDVVDVARSGERMPQKASYFWPKAITGLVFRPLH